MEFNGTTVAPSTYTLHDGSKIEIPAGRHIKHWSYWCACSTYALGPQTHTRAHTLQTLLLVYNRASRCASHPTSHRRDRDVLPRDQEVHQARGPHGEFIWGSRGCPRSPRICCRGAVGRQGRWATHLPPPHPLVPSPFACRTTRSWAVSSASPRCRSRAQSTPCTRPRRLTGATERARRPRCIASSAGRPLGGAGRRSLTGRVLSR